MTARVVNLPTQWTSFIGRSADVAGVQERLAESRLVTLVGPGGVGKTRLAIEAAATTKERFAGGIWFVELMDAGTQTEVISTIWAALATPELNTPQSLAGLVERLPIDDALLVLDNCEHLIEEVGEIAVTLLSHLPNLRILTTSRERLSLDGEFLWLVDSLGFPGGDDSSWYRSPLPEALELFQQRGRAVDPGFEITESNAAAVASICRRLDGLPLAIELAAARLGLFSAAAIDERLREALEFLDSPMRNRPRRHASLHDVAAWSYALLSDLEQEVFSRLGVFSGGFDLAFARVVAGPSLHRTDFEAVVESLVAKSLVARRSRGGPTTRLRLLESLKVFSTEQLVLTDRLEETRRIHAARCADRADAAADELWSAEQASALDAMELDHDNVRTALSWAIEREDAELAQRLSGALFRFWDLRGYYDEGYRWCQRACALDGQVSAPVAVRALNGLATLSVLTGEVAGAIRASEAAIALAEEHGEYAELAYAQQFLGLCFIYLEDLDRAEEVLGRSISAARQAESLVLSGWSLLFLAAVHNEREGTTSLVELVDEAAESLAEADESEGLGWCHLARGHVALRLGDPLTAATEQLAALDRFSRLRAAWGSATVGIMVSRILAELEEWERSVRLLGESERLRSAVGATHLPVYARWVAEGTQTAVEAIGSSAVDEILEQASRRPAIEIFDSIADELNVVVEELSAAREPPRPLAATTPEAPVARLERKGELWTVTFDGSETHLRHLVGLAHIATLLANPGRQFAAVELAAARSEARRIRPEGQSLPPESSGPSGHAGERLDAEAIRSYRARAEELRDEIEEAEAWTDSERVAQAREELEWLVQQLGSSVGLGGRPRRDGSDAERARVNVTKAIRSAIRKIDGASPALGRHLEISVATGAFCRYRPDPSSPMTWVVSA